MVQFSGVTPHREDDHWQIGIEDFADYHVTIGPLNQSTIPTSGVIKQRQKNEKSLWTITSEASNIPDFGLVLSHANYVVSGKLDDVTINCFYICDKDVAERILNITKDIIRFYQNMYGFYPDTVINIIAFDSDGFGGGPIGSNILHVNKSFHQNEDYTIWGIAHEVAHQYWGWNWVIDQNSKLYTRWLCFGMGLWSDLQYMNSRNKKGLNASILSEYVNASKHGVNTRLHNPTAKDLENRMDEKTLSHSKGYALVLMLEYLVGQKPFQKIARTTLQRFAHQTLTTEKLQRVCEEISGLKLDWFFHQWVFTNNILDYSIANIEVTRVNSQQQITVSIEPKGLALMPIDVALEFTDGSFVCQRIPQNEQSCIFTSRKTWQRVVIDPNNCLPDVNRPDNTMVKSQVSSSSKMPDKEKQVKQKEEEKRGKAPFLASEMSEAEAQAIEEFRRIRKKILGGERYEDSSTPFRAVLTFLSALHFRDVEAYKRIYAVDFDKMGKKPTRVELLNSEQYLLQFDILRSPLPPEQPEEGTFWPIYVRRHNEAVLADTLVPVFWKGKWMWIGNMGTPDDWRSCIPLFKDYLERYGK